ncbi:MAG: type II toxin-antitoxin system RelE/ParE family toxin [Streptococcaceae bacterium]|nr:type II toxin-antitoxin system RelE/ParE family toxin [Streptococcaceae bacterium]
MDNYEITVQISVFEQIRNIENYISNVLLSSDSAEKRKERILSEIKQLSLFPERGFDADEKIGTKIVHGYKTIGIPIVDGKYLVLYHIDNENKIVNVIDLLATQSDYAKLFL